MQSVLRRALCLAALASPTLLGAPAAAQWASTSYDPTKPVVEEGFLVLHEDSVGLVKVFSAAAQRWTTLAPPGSILYGTGDWTVLYLDPDFFHGYSARRNSSAMLVYGGQILHTYVDDDVALVVRQTPFNPAQAHAYSAVTNAWATINLTNPPSAADIAVSRFVIGIRQEDGYWGFAARTGQWSFLPTGSPGAPPQADGNVLLADLTDPLTGSGQPNVAAFSGVRGNWDVSPPYTTALPNVVLLDHNVAYTRAQDPDLPASQYFGCAYSAYEGLWFTSPVARAFLGPFLTESLRDNLIVLAEIDGSRYEAFGSEPAVWATLTGDVYTQLVLEESYVILADSAVARLWAFSGECTGAWTPRPITGGVATPVGSGDHSGMILGTLFLYGFSPASSTWASPLLVSGGAPIFNEDAVTNVLDFYFLACAARNGAWVGGPVIPPGGFTTVSGGSVIAHQLVIGASPGDVYVFDERMSRWPAPFNPGGVSALTPGRNLLISDLPGVPDPIWGYSVQRGDWTRPAGFVGPVAVAPVTEENVAWTVDSQGQLWAFGSPNEGHVWHAWPNGTEYHTSGTSAFGNTPFVAYGIKGNPGDAVWVLASTSTVSPPLVIPGIGGALCLNPALLFNLGYWGTVDFDGLLEQQLFLFSPLPPCVQLWFQPLILDAATLTLRWGHRCDPGWFF